MAIHATNAKPKKFTNINPTQFQPESPNFLHASIWVSKYRRLRSLSTCAYPSNSADTSAKKRAVLTSESMSRSRPSFMRPHLSSSTWQLADKLEGEKNGLDLG